MILLDTDHIGNQPTVGWVWKSFCRGLNPLLMENYSLPGDNSGTVQPDWENVRKNMGYARAYAQRMNLAKAVPCDDLVSTKYCLSDRENEFLIFIPEELHWVNIDFAHTAGFFNVEWLNTRTGEFVPAGQIAGGSYVDLVCPFAGGAVLYLWKAPGKDPQ